MPTLLSAFLLSAGRTRNKRSESRDSETRVRNREKIGKWTEQSQKNQAEYDNRLVQGFEPGFLAFRFVEASGF